MVAFFFLVARVKIAWRRSDIQSDRRSLISFTEDRVPTLESRSTKRK